MNDLNTLLKYDFCINVIREILANFCTMKIIL
jgi:hypothetical protein